MKKFNSYLLTLYRGALEKSTTEFKDWALNEAKSLISFDSCVWGTGSWIENQPRIHSVHLHELGNDFVASWMQYQDEDKLARTIPFNIDKTFNVDVEAEYAGTAIREFHCKRFAMEHIVATATIDEDTQLLNTMSLYRSNPSSPFTECERVIKEEVFPHLIEAARINWLTNLPHLLSANKRSTFNSIAACDSAGILHVAMPSFMETCRIEWPLWKGPVLPDQVQQAMKGGALKFVGSHIVVSMCTLDELLLIRARVKISADKLTHRELEVAQRFSDGADYKTIAQELALSPSTIKVHLNNIYTKMGVNDKTSLAAEMRMMVH